MKLESVLSFLENAILFSFFFFCLFFFKTEKTGGVKTRENWGDTGGEEKCEPVSITQQGCYSFQVDGFFFV